MDQQIRPTLDEAPKASVSDEYFGGLHITAEIQQLPKMSLDQLKEKAERFTINSPELGLVPTESETVKLKETIKDSRSSSEQIKIAKDRLCIPFKKEAMQYMLAGIHLKYAEANLYVEYITDPEHIIDPRIISTPAEIQRSGHVELFSNLRRQIFEGHKKMFNRASQHITWNRPNPLTSTRQSDIRKFLGVSKNNYSSGVSRIESAAVYQLHGIEQGLQYYFEQILASQIDKDYELRIWQQKNYYYLTSKSEDHDSGRDELLNPGDLAYNTIIKIKTLACTLTGKFGKEILYMYPIGEN